MRFNYSITTFHALSGGDLVRKSIPELPVGTLLTDSRLYQGQEGAIFFAIRSQRNDGHKYLQSLYNQGLRQFVISDRSYLKHLESANVILVDDAVKALQSATAKHRMKFDVPVVGVTGSNGKTVVKEWLFQLMHKYKRVLRSPRSYNSQIGVPLSVWLLNEQHELAIFEAGISQPGEMILLEEILKPQIGILTNIGEAHQEYFDSYNQKLHEKLALFKRSKCLVFCSDHALLHREIPEYFAKEGPQLLDWGSSHEASLCVAPVQRIGHSTSIRGRYRDEHGNERAVAIQIPFGDAASVENACHCWRLLLHLGLPDEAIAVGMLELSPIAMRLQQMDAVSGSTVINDVYNSDLNSLEIALDQLTLQRKHSYFTAIVSDIAQSAEPPEQLYAKMAEMVRLRSIDHFIGIGPQLSKLKRLFEGVNAHFFKHTEDFIKSYHKNDFARQNILVKGARQFQFERIIDLLSEKTHETKLEIDLERLRDNLNHIRAGLRPNTAIMVMVKAFAYGSGAYEVARTLEFHGVDYLAVAYADEGITLREAGIKLPILVLNPEIGSYQAMIRFRLEPQLYSFRTLEHFEQALFALDSGLPYPVHLKINTGMNRLGFDLSEIADLAYRLTDSQTLHVATVFTHLAASESEAFDGLTARQIGRFEEAVKGLHSVLPKGCKLHVLNSQGVFRHPDAQYDMVRLGLALYGISSNPEYREGLKPVSRLITTISQIRQVPAGEGIGYSPKKLLEEDTVVAVIPIGYADGLPRKLGNGKGHVSISGKRCPILGNVCMDMTMVDVTQVACKEGDEVEIFGDHLDIYELSAHLGTIPYEVLTSISQRVKRVYLHQ